jgi:hypothetical protein
MIAGGFPGHRGKMLTAENEKLIQDYLDIAVNASENLERTMDSLSEDCNWYITLPGIAFTEKSAQVVYRDGNGFALAQRRLES